MADPRNKNVEYPYFMVMRHGPQNPQPPHFQSRVKHPTFESAREEVQRLREKHPAARFVILKAVAQYRPLREKSTQGASEAPADRPEEYQ